MSVRFSMLLVALLSLAFAPSPFPKPDRPSRESTDLYGVWLDDLGHSWLITSTRMTLDPDSDRPWPYELTVDRTVRPARYEIRGVANSPTGSLHFKGIYRVRGNVLTCTFNPANYGTPVAFEGHGKGMYVSTYRRVRR